MHSKTKITESDSHRLVSSRIFEIIYFSRMHNFDDLGDLKCNETEKLKTDNGGRKIFHLSYTNNHVGSGDDFGEEWSVNNSSQLTTCEHSFFELDFCKRE